MGAQSQEGAPDIQDICCVPLALLLLDSAYEDHELTTSLHSKAFLSMSM